MRPEQPPRQPERNILAQNGRRILIGLAILGVILVIAGVLLFKYWKKKEETTTKVPPPSGDELQVHVLNVGQGDSILIIAPGGKSVLVDAGVPGSGRVVLDAMQRYGVDHLDLMVATHAHADHIGGADEVMPHTKASALLDSHAPTPTKNYEFFLKAIDTPGEKYFPASPGQKFDLGGGGRRPRLRPLLTPFQKKKERSG